MSRYCISVLNSVSDLKCVHRSLHRSGVTVLPSCAHNTAKTVREGWNITGYPHISCKKGEWALLVP